MRIAGVASAFPKHYYKQEVLVEALKDYWQGKLAARHSRPTGRKHEGGRTLHGSASRFLHTMQTWGEANDVWIEVGLEIGEKALCRALVGAGLEPRDLSAIFVTSVTGIAAPSLDARLDQPDGPVAQHQAHSDFRAGLRGRRGGDFARRRLRARPIPIRRRRCCRLSCVR